MYSELTIAQKVECNLPLSEREKIAMERDNECPDHELAIMDWWDEH